MLPVQLHASRDAVILAGELIILAERVTFPIVGAQDPAEIGVAREIDAEEIKGFTLVPVGGGPEVGDGIRVPS